MVLALDPQTEFAARAFLKRLEGRYATRQALVFGSRARHTHGADSDADLAVIVKGKPGSRFRVAGEMAEIAFDVMQETGILIDPLPLWDDELNHPQSFANPKLIEMIMREGVRL
jgi:predicted nucleotidyltransferase